MKKSIGPNIDLATFYAIKYLMRVEGIDSFDTIGMVLRILHPSGKNRGLPNRPYIQNRMLLAQMPDFVQGEFVRLMTDGPSATPVRFSDVKSLFSAYSAEYADYPDGDGPEFRRVWNAIVVPAGWDKIEGDADCEDSADSAGDACFTVFA